MSRSLLASMALLSTLACAAPRPRPIVPEARVEVVGEDRGAGNVVLVQPWFSPWDYASEADYARALDGWIALADDALGRDTIVVLPEYVGTWLVALGAPEASLAALDTRDAMTPIVRPRLRDFVRARRAAPDGVEDRSTYAIFSMSAETMAAAYQRAMSDLAASHAVTLVAGSILLPEPRVEAGEILVEPGAPMRNASFVFGPDGALLGPPVLKAFPTADELGFISPAPAADLPVFDTPAGRLGVLICADSWFPAAYRALGPVDVLVVPVYVSHDGLWDQPWSGYSGWPNPDDVEAGDVGGLREGEAWQRYAYPRRAREAGIPLAAGVPLRGQLWDLGDDGPALVLREGRVERLPEADAPRVFVIWR